MNSKVLTVDVNIILYRCTYEEVQT